MPTYEYKCIECGHKFEKFQMMTDEPVKTCEKCGAPVRKLFGTGGVIFKGSGFYVNDYKKGSDPEKRSSVSAGEACAGCAAAGSCPASGGSSD
ncbi:MAG TPA: zinc ribbon domain-containing protein [Spirochaetota bacterium]|nr:zinc ribbon domain-containing protein [Spirochaetota bacterium]HPI90131.1 zinc ribbon domain-containing protein [Spirochaetota bacterium]HPR49153.1 zinc ribbon domain-containing protein [Spirochaetota bacterium]